MTTMQKDAVALIQELSEEQVAALLDIMRAMSHAKWEDMQAASTGVKRDRVLGIAKGKFACPDDIDEDNDLIAHWFEGTE